MTFEELKQALFVRSNFGMKLGLDRMREALRLLGDPFQFRLELSDDRPFLRETR